MTKIGSTPHRTDPSASQQIPVNVYETSDSLVIVAPMPGVQAEDITITLEPGHLVLHADQRSEADRRDYQLHEWNYGPYERELDLPDDFAGSVVASLGQGQLAVRVLRAAEGTEQQQHQVVTPAVAGHE